MYLLSTYFYIVVDIRILNSFAKGNALNTVGISQKGFTNNEWTIQFKTCTI